MRQRILMIATKALKVVSATVLDKDDECHDNLTSMVPWRRPNRFKAISDHNTPCQQCGACCAAFRVSFYWSEAIDLPEEHIEQVTPWVACMAGTNSATPRCAGLDGIVGRSVQCTVYEQRPSPCREVMPGDAKCTRAREYHGLPHLVIG